MAPQPDRQLAVDLVDMDRKEELIIAKQRNGPIGDIKVLWQHDFTRFVNLEHRPHDEFEQFSGF